MNTNLFWLQIKQAFKNKAIAVTFLVGIGLVFFQERTTNNWEKLGLSHALLHIVGIDKIGDATNLYLIILPFLACYLSASIIKKDVFQKTLEPILVRMPKKTYYKTSACAAFFIGGITGSMPLYISSWWSFVNYANSKMNVFSSFYPIDSEAWLFPLYGQHPFLFWLLIVFLYFVFCGCISLVGLALSFYVKTKYFETILPFFLMYIGYIFFSMLGYPELSPYTFLSPSSLGVYAHTDLYYLTTIVVYFLFSLWSIYQEVKKDVLYGT